MTPHGRWSLLVSLPLLAATSACLPLPFMRPEPGVEMVVAVRAEGPSLEESVARTVEVIASRCELMNLTCDVRPEGGGSNRITARVSGRMDWPRVKDVLLSRGLEVRAVAGSPYSPLQVFTTADDAAAANPGRDVLPYREAEEPTRSPYADGSAPAPEPTPAPKYIAVERGALITGHDVLRAKAGEDMGGTRAYAIYFTLRPEGAARFEEWTSTHVGSHIAVVMNGEALSVAQIRSAIKGDGQITGSFTKERAEDTARVLSGGNLPAPVELLEERGFNP